MTYNHERKPVEDKDLTGVSPNQDVEEDQFKASWTKKSKLLDADAGTYDDELQSGMWTGGRSSMYATSDTATDNDLSEMFDDSLDDVPPFDELPSVLFLTGDIDKKTLQKSMHLLQQKQLMKTIQERNSSKQTQKGSDKAVLESKPCKMNKNKTIKVSSANHGAERHNDKQIKNESVKEKEVDKAEHYERSELLHTAMEASEETMLIRRKRIEKLEKLNTEYETFRKTEESTFKPKLLPGDNREVVLREEKRMDNKERSNMQHRDMRMANFTVVNKIARSEKKEVKGTHVSDKKDLERPGKRTKTDIPNAISENDKDEIPYAMRILISAQKKKKSKVTKNIGAFYDYEFEDFDQYDFYGDSCDDDDDDSDEDSTDDDLGKDSDVHYRTNHAKTFTTSKVKQFGSAKKSMAQPKTNKNATASMRGKGRETTQATLHSSYQQNLISASQVLLSFIKEPMTTQKTKTKSPIKNKNLTANMKLDSKNKTINMKLDSKTIPANIKLDSKDQTANMKLDSENQTANMKLDSKNKTANMKLDIKNKTANMKLDSKNKTVEEKEKTVPDTVKIDMRSKGRKTNVLKLHLDNVDEKRAKAFKRIKQGNHARGVHCASCGRPDCNSTNIKKMKELIEVAKHAGFDVNDVAPDGNCMFAAIVDQLEFYRNFQYDSKSLREGAVNWLIENPNSEDGTPFASFLEQDWQTYLQRMLGEGQWGDHIVLKAIVQVIGCTVKVMNVDKGKGHWITLEPSNKQAEKQPVILGHVGEFHYVSLRPSDYQRVVRNPDGRVTADDDKQVDVDEDLSKIQLEGSESIAMFQEGYIDPESDKPVLHFSFLLRHIVPRHFIDEAAILTSQVEENVPKSMKELEYAVIGEVANRAFIHLSFGQHMSSVGKRLHIYKDPCVVSKMEASTHREAPTLDESAIHPGYAKIEMPVSRGYKKYKPSKEFRLKEIAPGDNNYFEIDGKLYTYKPLGDIVHTIFCASWPGSAQSWKTRARYENWPPQHIIDMVVTSGCILKPYPHTNSQQPDNDWEIGFDLAEKTLFKEAVTPSQQYCYILWKALLIQIDDHTGPLSLAHLRTVFLYSCERIPGDIWMSNPGACLLYMFDQLLHHIKEKQFPNYFVPTNNMVDHFTDRELQVAVEKTMSVRNQPLVFLFQFHEACNYLARGRMVFQMVQDDIPKFCGHRSIKLTTLETFVPASILIAKEYLKAGYFVGGFERLSQIYEERLAVSTCDDTLPYHLFLQDALNELDYNTIVWFSAYVELHMKGQLPRPIVLELSGNRELVKISDIIPGECAREFAETLVSKALSYNIFSFCNEFAMFLREIGKADSVKSVLYYAHEQYKSYIANAVASTQEGDRAHEFPMMEIYSGLKVVYTEHGQKALMSEFYPCMEQLVSRLTSYYACMWLMELFKALNNTEKADILQSKMKEFGHLNDELGIHYFKRCSDWPYRKVMAA